MDVKNDIKNLKLLNVEQHMADNVKKNEISKESINLYNKALGKAKRDGEDIAIIELKRALTYNENFIEALTLLGYCYLITNNQVEAKKYLFKATQLSEYGIRAYMLLRGMGVLDMPEEIITNNKLDKKNVGVPVPNNAKGKTKAENNENNEDNEDNEMSGGSIHAVGFAGRSRKAWIIPALLIMIIPVSYTHLTLPTNR